MVYQKVPNSEQQPSTEAGLKLMAKLLVRDMQNYSQSQYIIISGPQEGTIEPYLQVSSRNEIPEVVGNDTAFQFG